MPKPKSERKPLDNYPTPEPYPSMIVAALAGVGIKPSCVVEPSAGDGSFIRAAKQIWPEVPALAIEINPALQPVLDQVADQVIVGDWAVEAPKLKIGSGFHPLLILGNPPFVFAQPHIEAALRAMRDGDHLAFLLRLSFLCSHERSVSFWARENGGGLKYLIPVAERPSFTGEGKSDASEYGVFVFEKGYVGRPAMLPHLFNPEKADPTQKARRKKAPAPPGSKVTIGDAPEAAGEVDPNIPF